MGRHKIDGPLFALAISQEIEYPDALPIEGVNILDCEGFVPGFVLDFAGKPVVGHKIASGGAAHAQAWVHGF